MRLTGSVSCNETCFEQVAERMLETRSGNFDRFCKHALEASPYRRTFIAISVSLWNDLADPVFESVGQADI